MSREPARIVGALAGLFLVFFGLWAFLAPESFYERVATFPPYNRHLIHDIGSFQTGLGATLLFAFLWTDVFLVVLAGTSVGFILHFFSHVMDRDLGGRATDPITLGLAMVAVVLAAIWRARAVGRSGPPPR